eukprot:TRINITY_DN537_c0_g1_i1.p1 TRINITY_DN537_c0_g1~~TRINITY_DN537_c0_g1_i1.p1  ORF type:complete len:129 (+),score=15.98 TRINITY_DN537_c0_g1_i1:58-387(+)
MAELDFMFYAYDEDTEPIEQSWNPPPGCSCFPTIRSDSGPFPGNCAPSPNTTENMICLVNVNCLKAPSLPAPAVYTWIRCNEAAAPSADGEDTSAFQKSTLETGWWPII